MKGRGWKEDTANRERAKECKWERDTALCACALGAIIFYAAVSFVIHLQGHWSHPWDSRLCRSARGRSTHTHTQLKHRVCILRWKRQGWAAVQPQAGKRLAGKWMPSRCNGEERRSMEGTGRLKTQRIPTVRQRWQNWEGGEEPRRPQKADRKSDSKRSGWSLVDPGRAVVLASHPLPVLLRWRSRFQQQKY